MKPLGFSKPFAYPVDFVLRRSDPGPRFLLEYVEHVHCFRELCRVYGTVGVGPMPLDDLHDPGTAEALERSGRRIGRSLLRGIEGLAEIAANLPRHRPQLAATRPESCDGPDLRVHINILIYV